MGNSIKIGKIKRVPLRDVWKHEAANFTQWLEQNIDVLNDKIELGLNNVVREKSTGNFSVDLVAEDSDGELVIIENQLEKSNHDHLGKLITYLSAIGAKTAIWIVSESRPEHQAAINWLNAAGSANFYMVKVEAIRIDDSPAAAHFEIMVGPSAEAKQIGNTKKEVSERHVLRKKWWAQLLERARGAGNLHAGCMPSTRGYMTSNAGIKGLSLNYDLSQKTCNPCLYIDRGSGSEKENKQIFDNLYRNRKDIEKVVGRALKWERMDNKRASRISAYLDKAGYRMPETAWPAAQDEVIRTMYLLEKAMRPYINELKAAA